LKVLQRRRIKIHLPVFMFKPLAFLMEKTMATPPLNRDQLIMLKEENVCSIEDIKRDFDLKPMRFEDAIKKHLT
jgi:hypothetical protein